jgi:Olfactomedin-like domain
VNFPRDFKCKDAITSLADLIIDKWNIAPTENAIYPGFPNRTLDCHLYAVGKPVYHKFSEQTYGAWMKDSLPKQESLAEKIWVTSENESQRLYEYMNKEDYRTNKHKKVHRLDRAFRVSVLRFDELNSNSTVYGLSSPQGNAHVVYNGSFYYCERDSPKIVKYDFSIDRIESKLRRIYKSSDGNTNE